MFSYQIAGQGGSKGASISCVQYCQFVLIGRVITIQGHWPSLGICVPRGETLGKFVSSECRGLSSGGSWSALLITSIQATGEQWWRTLPRWAQYKSVFSLCLRNESVAQSVRFFLGLSFRDSLPVADALGGWKGSAGSEPPSPSSASCLTDWKPSPREVCSGCGKKAQSSLALLPHRGDDRGYFPI